MLTPASLPKTIECQYQDTEPPQSLHQGHNNTIHILFLMKDYKYPCTEPSPRRRPRPVTREIYPVGVSQVRAPYSPATSRYRTSQPRGSQTSLSTKAKAKPFVPTQTTFHGPTGPNFKFHQFANPLKINTYHGIHVPERKKYFSKPPHHHQNIHSNPRQARVHCVSLRTNTWKKNTLKLSSRLCLFPHRSTLYRTLLAHIEILFCFGRPPKRLLEHHHTKQGPLHCLSKADPQGKSYDEALCNLQLLCNLFDPISTV